MIVKSWDLLVLASVLLVTFGGLLVRFVRQLVRSNRDQILAVAALLPEQEVTISEPGEILLLLETPRFGSAFRNFQFEVVEAATGQSTRMKYEYLRAQGAVYGVTTMRIPLGRMTAQQAGIFLVRVFGLQAGTDYSTSRIMFSRPYLGRMVGQILGIVVCGIGMLLSLLFALWQLFPLQSGG